MSALVALVAGAAVSALVWFGLRNQLAVSPVLRRQNYRGHELPVAAGIVIVLAVVAVAAAWTTWLRAGGTTDREAMRAVALVSGGTVGFGLIGLFDDLVGATSTKGFRGHLGALRHGEITTGLVKLVWGVAFGVLAVPGDLGESLRGGLLVAAAANLGNLLDRAPGRVVKCSVLGAVVVSALGAPAWHLAGPMLVVGAGVGLLIPDLREQCMLGDTGSNVLGAAIGYGLVLATGATGEWIALVVVVVLNLASEVVSFTSVIDAVAPLRWLDRLGTVPERRHERRG